MIFDTIPAFDHVPDAAKALALDAVERSLSQLNSESRPSGGKYLKERLRLHQTNPDLNRSGKTRGML